MGGSRRRKPIKHSNQSRNRRPQRTRSQPRSRSARQVYPAPKRPGVALGLSIAGLFIPILAPIAWVFANFALIDHRGTPDEPMSRAAQVLGILGTLLLVLETILIMTWS